uniref:Superfamily I DNA or RNA helicase or helicase subunit-like protein n=1 Tax=Caulobacter sp. (strain K31) TaxID=366602 RepID=B0T8Q0_CAUSK
MVAVSRGAVRKPAKFLEGYKLHERYLLRPVPATGKPGIIEATSPRGDEVLLRIWPRKTRDDDDLLDIWRHELRQLHRLGGYPGAQRYVARVLDAGSDAEGFYIVLDAGQRRPLELILERGRGSTEWLRSLNLSGNRYRLWRNLQQVCRGLEILHNEGLVHRNLDGWSILTAAGDDPDFQLTGFEWSIRLSATSDVAKKARGPAVPTVSFAADWSDFARLAARIFNITPSRLVDAAIPDYSVHESALASEIRLLRDLLLPTELPRLDGELVSNRIDQILGGLDADKAAGEGKYHLVARLGSDSDLSRAIRQASGQEIEVDDDESQITWMDADLGDPIQLSAVTDGQRVLLYARGRELIYRLKPYRGGAAEGSWQFAFCESAEPAIDWRRTFSSGEQLPSIALKLVSQREARPIFGRLKGRSPSWQDWLDRLADTAPVTDTARIRLHRAFTLLHAVEIAFAAATTYPVNVKTDSDGQVLTLTYRTSTDREALSKALKLDPPAARMRSDLDQENTAESEGWVLTESARLGRSQSTDVELAYDEAEDTGKNGAKTEFQFRATSPAPVLFREGFLAPAGARGDFSQFNRRSKAIRLLKEHQELLDVLSDPRSRLTPSHDVVTQDTGFAALDLAKQQALAELSAILPIYLLQGPPGVGKTFLITDLVRRRFEDDRSGRILITAQGNHPLDHLLDEVAALWTGDTTEPPLAVRCRPRDDNVSSGPFDLSTRTAEVVQGLADCKLAEGASETVKTRLRALAGEAGRSKGHPSAERRSLEGLVMRAANLVFATTNSGDLERLVEERGQFDWTIIEEAGKATGCELVTPLMLSHRRLLIGDHKQLPPFGADQLEAFLNDAAAVRAALTVLPRVIDPTVKQLLEDELVDFLEDEQQDVEALCAEAKRVLYLFETALTGELERQKSRKGHKVIASTLTVQHRMHPTICELVSESFYGDLHTSETRQAQAIAQARWIASRDPEALPDAPVVLIDMPYERSTIGAGRIETLPRFSNAHEVAEVVKAVGNLRVTEEATKVPSLVILTPYKRQVTKINNALATDDAATQALNAFKPAARGGAWCSTVDAFQGNEADVVVFSLVRNNRGATISKALGFVGDPRRFNVLLSRARQRLIFVGSRDFLAAVANPLGLEKDPEHRFLGKFLATLDQQIQSGKACRVEGSLLSTGAV